VAPLVVPTGTITGQVINASSGAVAGALVVAKLNAGQFVPQSIAPAGQIVPQEVTTFSGSDGSWSLPLVPNNNITPANTTYTISVQGMPDVQIVLLDTASHPYMSLVTSPSGATLQPVAQTIAGNLIVSGTLLVSGATTLSGALAVAGDATLFAAGQGRTLEIDDDSSGAFTSSTLKLALTAGALPNVGHEQWIIRSMRPGVGGVSSNTRFQIFRTNPGQTNLQEYFRIDEVTGQVRIGDTGLVSVGVPSPGLGGVILGGHIRSTGTASPTISNINPGISGTPVVIGNDRSGIVTFNTGVAPPAAGSILFRITFATAYSAVPMIQITFGGSGGTPVSFGYGNASTTVFDVFAIQAPAASNGYTVAYLVEEHSP
jgi:hypothetical protein